jgi:hypothetical protein
LADVKRSVNLMVQVLERMVPQKEARLPVSRLAEQLCSLLLRASRLAPKEFYADANYPRLVQVVGKVLVFVAEEDGHYAGQLAQAMLLVHDLVEETRREFPPGREGDIAWMHWASGHPILEG